VCVTFLWIWRFWEFVKIRPFFRSFLRLDFDQNLVQKMHESASFEENGVFLGFLGFWGFWGCFLGFLGGPPKPPTKTLALVHSRFKGVLAGPRENRCTQRRFLEGFRGVLEGWF